MVPEEEIAAFLRGKGVQRAVINDMLRGFAHDLAEAIRQEAQKQRDQAGPYGLDYTESAVSAAYDSAADLIDPEVPDAE